MKFNEFKDQVEFFNQESSGPEAFDLGESSFYKARCLVYAPTEKDYRLGNLDLSNKVVTIILRQPPKVLNIQTADFLELRTGIYKGERFNIKHVSMTSDNYLKIVGEVEWHQE
ncbi:hypothetical protein C7J88_09685 [Staphylococcus muscae]|uniref:Phage protein n=1 Tax=Staphylococcus muscae TaxID=1294 RepID=A0A240C0V4_9STAP|nr:hypothetical protein [Staphylococcus muscae]AVQ34420.1 hypothetical protein C7J88_09685 [Staphylococcus muscae]PNZ03547.1 hypothetical protein CD131_06035 [Staphylococcus muscae]GGA93240.1 hypothetical protein GCM10007183_16770 [Staphylococcus muscae]SNW00718.1 phage protein [Staphylococcus muscae]